MHVYDGVGDFGDGGQGNGDVLLFAFEEDGDDDSGQGDDENKGEPAESGNRYDGKDDYPESVSDDVYHNYFAFKIVQR